MKIKTLVFNLMASCCAAQISFALPAVEDVGESLSAAQAANNTLITSPVTQSTSSFESSQNTTPKVSSINEDLLEKIHALEQAIPEMQGKIDELQHELKRTQEESAKQFIMLNQKLADISTTTAPAPILAKTTSATNVVAAPTNVPTSKTSTTPEDQEKKTYEAAYSLVSTKAYADAIEAFNGYLSIFPDGKYAANANYWLGELNANQQKYPDAIKYLQNVVNDYPQSNKVSDAMLKLGIINKRLGNNAKAQTWFNQLIKQYPQSKAAQSAKQYLS